MCKITVLLLLQILILGCISKTRVPLSPEQIVVRRTILHQLQERSDKIHSLSGAARIALRTPEGPYAVEEIIRLRLPDALRLESRDPMGGLHILLIARGTEGAVLFPGRAVNTRFSVKPGTLKRYLGLDLSFPELLGMFTGTPPLPFLEPDQIRVVKEEQDEVTRVQLLEKGRPSQEVSLDRTGRVFRWVKLDAGGEANATILFQDFREQEGITIPYEIIYQGSEGTRFTLRYWSVFLNLAIEDKLFAVSRIGEVLDP